MAVSTLAEKPSGFSSHQLSEPLPDASAQPSDSTSEQHEAHQIPLAQAEINQLSDADIEYPSMRKLAVILPALYLAVFLVALDRTIVATAVVRITDTFSSLADVGWYGSAYLLTACSFQLVFGRLFTFYSPKLIMLSAIIVFEIGSTVCAAAPSSAAFIAGRAIAGLGAAGIFSGAIIVMTYTLPLHKRPLYSGLTGGVFAVASVLGPVLGGLLTDRSSWRWCFWINLPIGAVALLVIAIFLHIPKELNPRPGSKTLRTKIAELDPLGTIVFVPSIVCLLLALQWGGSRYAWSDGRIIALLTLFAVLFFAFVIIQSLEGDMATVPLRIIRRRGIWSAIWYSFTISASFLILVYYLPIWFQAVTGVSAVESGIRTLPFVLSLVLGAAVSGASIRHLGYFTPFMLAASVITSVGAGLITTLRIDATEAAWFGFQVLYGFGLGLGMQLAGLAAQTCLARADVSTGVSLAFFAQSLGGAVFITVAQNLFEADLLRGLAQVPDLDPRVVLATGATQLRDEVPPQLLDLVLVVYNAALTKAFQASLAMACLSMLGAVASEWNSVKPPVVKADETADGGASERQS